MKRNKIAGVVFLVSMALGIGASNFSFANNGVITSEQDALNALNKQFGAGFVSNPGTGPGYQVSNGTARDITAPDPFADNINGSGPLSRPMRFPGCEGMGREIGERLGRTTSFSDITNPDNAASELENRFGGLSFQRAVNDPA